MAEMHRKPMDRNLTRAFAIGSVVVGTFMIALPASAQQTPPAATSSAGSRYRVLVPTPEIKSPSSKKFAEQLADAMRKDIDKLPTHISVQKSEVSEALKKFHLKEEEMDCVKSRQLAVQINAELVMCGTVDGSNVSAQFIGSKTGETFEVPSFASSDPLQAEKTIYNAFEKYINQLSLTAFCTDYLASSQWQNAIDNCTKALAVNAQSSTGLYGRARGYMGLADVAEQAKDTTTATTDYAKALVDLKQALVVNATSQEALRAAGIVSARLGKPEESRNFFKQYLELNPGAYQVRLSLAQEAAKSGDPEGALKMAEEGIQGDSAALDVLTFAGHWAMQAAQKTEAAAPKPTDGAKAEMPPAAAALYEKANTYYQKAIAKSPNDVDAAVYVNNMIALNALNRPADAVAVGAKATSIPSMKDKSAVWIQYAEALEASGKHPEALAALDEAAKDPKATRVYVRRGGWELQHGNVDAARAAFKTAVERNELPADDIAKTIFAVAYNEKFKKGQTDDALQYFDLVRDVATSPEVKGMANFWSGYVYFQKAAATSKANTPVALKASVPIYQKALDFFNDADAFAATNAAVKGQINQMASYSRSIIETVRKGPTALPKKKPA
jgi:tetratricopeptide (TPR) repeat protein